MIWCYHGRSGRRHAYEPGELCPPGGPVVEGIENEQTRLARRVAVEAYGCLRDGMHTVVTIDGAGKVWAPGVVYDRRSSAMTQATRLADDLHILAYTVSRHGDELTVYGGAERLLATRCGELADAA